MSFQTSISRVALILTLPDLPVKIGLIVERRSEVTGHKCFCLTSPLAPPGETTAETRTNLMRRKWLRKISSAICGGVIEALHNCAAGAQMCARIALGANLRVNRSRGCHYGNLHKVGPRVRVAAL